MARILVVDREAGPARTLASALESVGHEVEMVGDTTSAYAFLRRQAPQMIVLDLMDEDPEQPGAQPEGVKLLAQFYLDHPEIPLIVYSSCTDYREHFWSWAAAAHLHKEEGPERVLDIVQELVGGLPA